MTVQELIELLLKEDPEATVLKTSQTGDYWNTTAAREIKEVSPGAVKYSTYHDTYALADEDDVDSSQVVLI